MITAISKLLFFFLSHKQIHKIRFRGWGGEGGGGVLKGFLFCGTPAKEIVKSEAYDFQSYNSAASSR